MVTDVVICSAFICIIHPITIRIFVQVVRVTIEVDVRVCRAITIDVNAIGCMM